VANCEIIQDSEFLQMINKNYIKSVKNQNVELKKAAKETKKYAEQIKEENDKLKTQLDKANKKIRSIELAKGFEK
jgi:FtsZ-binding cell division protein ZapB